MSKSHALTFMKLFALIAIIVSQPLASTGAARADQKVINVGGGSSVRGVYHTIGASICDLVNLRRKEHGIRCSMEKGGSIPSLRSIRKGNISFGVAQSDYTSYAYRGLHWFYEDGPNKNLRAVFSVHPEIFTLIARKAANVKDFLDLKGKRVNIHLPKSNMRIIMNYVLVAFDLDTGFFGNALTMKSRKQRDALCKDKMDVAVWAMMGHPNQLVQDISEACSTVILSVKGPEIDKLVAENPFFIKTEIPGGMYIGNPNDIPGVGFVAMIVSSSETSEETVYEVVKAVFENLENFKAMHPALAPLEKKRMISDGISIPLHDGAVRYYKEAGLM